MSGITLQDTAGGVQFAQVCQGSPHELRTDRPADFEQACQIQEGISRGIETVIRQVD